MNFNIPSDAKNYLEYRYGKRWEIPKKDWIGAEQDGTIFEKNNIIKR